MIEKTMMTKTVRSRSRFEIGEKVEGCTILEKSTIIPPDPVERRLGVYDYLVEAPPLPVAVVKGKPRSARKAAAPAAAAAPETSSFTRSTPDEMGSVIRRLPSR